MSPVFNSRLKPPVYASLALTFSGVGDAFLYPFLPLNHAAVGVPIVWVGVLLSVNRFVRILSNTWTIHLFAKYGLRSVTVIAVLLAIVSTAGYTLANSIFLWLIFRVVWGLSFSAMRISTLGYSLEQSQPGLAFGLTRGIQEVGPTIALFLAPVILRHYNHNIIFLMLAGFSLPALYFAFKLPSVEYRPRSTSEVKLLQIPSVMNSITFATAFLIDGIIVVALGILFLRHKEGITLLSATTIAAVYLGYRKVCLVIFSPLGGWAADKVGIQNVFNVSLAALITGIVILTSGWIEVGVIILFTFYSIHAAITPASVSGPEPHALSAMAENATWRDIGAAIGTLTGGVLLTSDYLTTILVSGIFILVLLLFVHLGTAQKAIKLLYLWK